MLRTDWAGTRLVRPLVNAVVPRDRTTVQVRSGGAEGALLVIDPREEKYYWTGTHEPAVQRALARELGQGMTAWDVGAHIGFLTVIASRAVGEEGHVHAFEPHDDNRARLLETLRLNDLDNVSVHDVALSSQAGFVPFYRHRFTTSWSLDAERGQGHEVDVRCTTLDALAGSLGAPNLIKIDAEGVELEVLRGGQSVIAETRPVLIVEFSTDQLVDDARSILSDYSFELLADRHWVMRPDGHEPSNRRSNGTL